MQAFRSEGDFRLVARVYQRVEGRFDEVADAAAENRLLAKQVGFRLFGKRRLDDAGPRAANRLGVGQGRGRCLSAGVLVDGHQARCAHAVDEQLAHAVAGAFGATRLTSIPAGDDLPIANVEPVAKHERLARR